MLQTTLLMDLWMDHLRKMIGAAQSGHMKVQRLQIKVRFIWCKSEG